MPRQRTAVLSAALLLFLLVGSVGVYAWYMNRQREEPPIRIGYLPIYVDLPLFVAAEKGFFAKHGVKFDLVRFASSPDIGTALTSRDIQFGASIAYAVVLANESRDPGKLKVFIVDSETAENYLSSIVVLKDSGIKTLADLKGKKLASFPGPTAVTFCKMVLEKNNLRPDTDVFVSELDSASHLDALTSKLVDALFTYEPTATQAVLERNAVKLLPGAVESQIIDPWQAGVWVVNTNFAAQESDKTKAVIAALYDAIDFIRQHPDEAKGALAKYTSIKPTVAQHTPNIPFAKLNEVDLVALQRQTDILHQRGIISKRLMAPSLMAPSTLAPR